jgi:hypothetical protein
MLTPATPITSALCNLLAWAEEANSRLPPPATVADKRGKYGCNPYTIPALNAAREALASLIPHNGVMMQREACADDQPDRYVMGSDYCSFQGALAVPLGLGALPPMKPGDVWTPDPEAASVEPQALRHIPFDAFLRAVLPTYGQGFTDSVATSVFNNPPWSTGDAHTTLVTQQDAIDAITEAADGEEIEADDIKATWEALKLDPAVLVSLEG